MKYRGKRIGQMDLDELDKHAVGLAMKVSIITGWQMPDSSEYANVFQDQLKKKMVDSYQDLTIDEIEYAMREFGTQVKDWGKSINLTLIDEPIRMYKAKREQLSEIEERAKMPELPAPVMEVNEDEFIETIKELFKETKLIGLIPERLFDILWKRKEIRFAEGEAEQIEAKVKIRLENEAGKEGLKAQKDLKHLQNSFPQEYAKMVKRECKRQAVAVYLMKQIEMDEF